MVQYMLSMVEDMVLDMSLESRNIHLNLGIDDCGGCSWPDSGSCSWSDSGGCLRREKEKYALSRMDSQDMGGSNEGCRACC